MENFLQLGALREGVASNRWKGRPVTEQHIIDLRNSAKMIEGTRFVTEIENSKAFNWNYMVRVIAWCN